jgi:drug/metabolite transporter (DMT)-like permease
MSIMMAARQYLILAVGIIAVSFAAIFIRLAQAPPLVIATYRMAIASVVLIPFGLSKARGVRGRLKRNDILLIALSSIALALHFALWITSLSYTSIASSVVIVTSNPIFVAVISYFLWQERLNRMAIAGIAIALGGVVLINYGGFIAGSRAVRGDLMALAAAIFVGIYLISGRLLRCRISLLPYLATVYSCATIVLLLVTLFSGYSLFGYSGSTYTMFFLLALIPQLIGHSSLNLSVRLMPATLVSVAILGEPVIAIILGYIILGEGVTLTEALGSLVTLGGILMVMLYRPKLDIIE